MTHQVGQHPIIALQGMVEGIQLRVGKKAFLHFAEAEAVLDGCAGSADFLRAVPNKKDASVSEPVQHQSAREYDNYDAGYHVSSVRPLVLGHP